MFGTRLIFQLGSQIFAQRNQWVLIFNNYWEVYTGLIENISKKKNYNI